MLINYVPNDPRASAFNRPRSQTPRKNRPKGRAGFDLGSMPAAKPYPVGSDDALAWQSREAAFAAVEVFETLHGPVKKWARSTRSKVLELTRDSGLDLNAYYDGEGVRFFHYPVGRVTKFSGASAEIVSHEVGHALLDTIRPALWDSNFPEVAAFHEAFGDCIAMLTAIADPEMRKALVRLVDRRNFAETFGEDLSWAALKVIGTKCNASKPRQARNTFQWALPATLAADGRGGTLINEPHSFGQVFTGCFYDIIALTFAHGARSEAALWNAAATAARALFAAAKVAPITPRFYQAVGRAMVLHDDSASPNMRAVVTQAFASHGIALGSAAATAPRATVAGGRLRRSAIGAPALMPATSADLRARLGVAKGTPLHVRGVTLGGERFVEATHERRVDLSGLARYLDGVSATGSEPILVAPVRNAMAIMSNVPDAGTTTDEVHAFVRGLVARDEIAHAGNTPALAAKRHGAVAAAPVQKPPHTARTHEVVRRRGEAMLQRVRFACGCGFCGL
jgi:hypothetical protein